MTADQHVIVALHGTASSGAQWQRIIQHFDPADIIHTPDLPGYGDSPRPAAPGISAYLDPIVQTIRAVGKPVHLVGHSFGGTCAMKIAADLPELVCQLSLYEPVLLSQALPDLPNLPAQSHPLRALWRDIDVDDTQAAIRSFCAFWGFPYPEHLSPQRLAQMQRIVLSDFDAAVALYETLQGHRIACPARIVYGGRSPAFVAQMMAVAGELLPNAETIRVPEADHLGPFFLPESVIPLLQERIRPI